MYEHLIQPFVVSEAPITHVSWGAAIGMFIGLTPTVGIQMYMAALIWVLCRYIFRFRFNLPVAVAMVWVTNPITVIPIYYVFFVTGQVSMTFKFDPEVLGLMNLEQVRIIYEEATKNPGATYFEILYRGIVSIFWTFGWPIVVGSLVWAIPTSVLTYPVTTFALLKYRTLMAEKEGVTYAEWKRTHIHPD